MKIKDYRDIFIKFYERNTHKILPSSSLIPAEDKSLMFTNSGMVQFKDYFTGIKPTPEENIATIQKCLRAGGKHNDLDNVGYTNRHHTFFEMMGHFSFGKYFKEEAIKLAWECITKEFSFEKEKLYVTVFHEDEETFNLWQKIANLGSDRIIKIKTQDNFWSMGNTGPCGPCSEIFYDLGENAKNVINGNFSGGVGESDRYVEIWNSVFMQFEKFEDGSMKPLAKKCIDTGAGLERIMTLKEEKVDNYESSFFQELIQEIANIYKVDSKNPKYFHSLRVISDHIRAISFMICDNILPGRNGREYVLRRIMRRAMRYAHILSETGISLHLILDKLCEIMPFYSELQENKEKIKNIINKEEIDFKELLINGLQLLNDEMKKNNNFISGEIAFKLYDTFGFPLDLTEDFARVNKIKIDIKKFKELMENQKNLGKANQKIIKNDITADFTNHLKENFKPNEKLYYDNLTQNNASLIGIFDLNFKQKIYVKNEECYILLDKTCIYPEGGGQVCDEGFIFFREKNESCKILHTIKVGEFILHKILIINEIKIKCQVEVQSLRKNVSANHTATHILQAALIKILGKEVQQKGSSVNESGLRFDFSYSGQISEIKKLEIENKICEIIKDSLPVYIEEKNIEDAKKTGALAFFDEKYGDKVRVISILNNNLNFKSIELCGGTHIKNTKQIGDFYISKCSSIGSGVIRIEAVTGEIATIQKNETLKLNKELEEMKKENLHNNKKITELECELGKTKIEGIANNEFQLKVVNYSRDSLLKIANNFKNERNGILKIFNKDTTTNKTFVIFAKSKNNTEYDCKKELLEFLKDKNGNGGGNNEMAQGSF